MILLIYTFMRKIFQASRDTRGCIIRIIITCGHAGKVPCFDSFRYAFHFCESEFVFLHLPLCLEHIVQSLHEFTLLPMNCFFIFISFNLTHFRFTILFLTHQNYTQCLTEVDRQLKDELILSSCAFK